MVNAYLKEQQTHTDTTIIYNSFTLSLTDNKIQSVCFRIIVTEILRYLCKAFQLHCYNNSSLLKKKTATSTLHVRCFNLEGNCIKLKWSRPLFF